MNVNEAIAAVKANPSDYESPLPWRADDTFVFAADGTAAAHWVKHSRAAHIAAAVNAVPLLIAEVERLQAVIEAERQAALVIAAACLDTGLVPQGASGTVDAVRAVCGHVVGLQAALAAARVAAKKLWTDCRDDCASVQPFLPGRDCDCGAEIAIELCRALGLE